MSNQKLDISEAVKSKPLEPAIKNHIQDTLIPGCQVEKIEIFPDGTAKVDIDVSNKRLGHLILITQKQEKQQKVYCSNGVLEHLVIGAVVVDLRRETAASIITNKLNDYDFTFARADEQLQQQLNSTPATNPLKAKFQYCLERSRILWARLRMSEKDREGKIHFTIPGPGVFTTNITLNQDEIMQYTSLEPYVQALWAMTALLRNPYDRNAYSRFTTATQTTLGHKA